MRRDDLIVLRLVRRFVSQRRVSSVLRAVPCFEDGSVRLKIVDGSAAMRARRDSRRTPYRVSKIRKEASPARLFKDPRPPPARFRSRCLRSSFLPVRGCLPSSGRQPTTKVGEIRY